MNKQCGVDKMVSHRVRGFGEIEQGPVAVERACGSRIPLLEIDTRVSGEGEIYVYHDPRWGKRRISDMDRVEMKGLRYGSGEPVLTFGEALEMFKRRVLAGQRLGVDIKDYGFEAEHLRAVRAAGLEEAVCFISWIPRSLTALNRLGCRCPLILSHHSLFKWGRLGRVMARLMKNRRFVWGERVVMGKNRALTDMAPYGHGFKHALYCRELPGPLVGILAGSGGGICIRTDLLNETLIRYCRQHRLETWVYGTVDIDDYLHYAHNPGVDRVFSDNAPAVFEYLSARKT
jgi:glycerophosphoryl diester phosphodiesterase